MENKNLEITLKEIVHLVSIYKNTISRLDATYFFLNSLRKQFPTKFLSKQGINVFLRDLSVDNNQQLQKLAEATERSQKRISDLKKTLQNETDPEKLKQIKIEIKKNEDNLVQLEIQNRYKDLILEVNAERIQYFYEDLLLFSANCKHEALDLWKKALAVHDDIVSNEEYYAAKLYIEDAEDFLKDKGFSKISADIRKAFVDSRRELKDLKIISSKAKSIRDASKQLLSAFESDEVNFRKFVDRKDKLGGL